MGREIGDIVVFTDLAGVAGRIFAVEHPNQANIVHTVLYGIERFEQSLQPITFDAQDRIDLDPRRDVRGFCGLVHDRCRDFSRRNRSLGSGCRIPIRIRIRIRRTLTLKRRTTFVRFVQSRGLGLFGGNLFGDACGDVFGSAFGCCLGCR
jgi:hypothetical protein